MARAICIFCGGGPTNQEHLFPDWINEQFPVGTTASLTLTRRDGTQFRWMDEPASATYKVVCEPCNSGWMSQVEERAKPHLTDLMQGRKCRFDVIAQLDLGTWATMKAYVRVAGAGPDVSDAESRRLLMQQRYPAANVRVLLAHYAPHRSLACYHYPVESAEAGPGVLDTPGFATTFVLIHGVLLVVGRERSTFSWPEATPRMFDNSRSIIPPFDGPIEWPAGRSLDENSIKGFAAQLLDIRSQD